MFLEQGDHLRAPRGLERRAAFFVPAIHVGATRQE